MPYNTSIPGQVSEFQLRAIETVAALVPEGGNVVEVGSLFGRSSWAWAKSVDASVTVHCIDPWEKNLGVRAMERRLGITYGLETFLQFTEDCPNVQAHQGYSPKDFSDWTSEIDLYYEDAVHTDPMLARNLDFWTEKLRPAGIICGDDYRPRFPDVMAGAQRLAERFQRRLLRVDFFWCLLPAETDLPGATAAAAQLETIAEEALAARREEGLKLEFGYRIPIETAVAGEELTMSCRAVNNSIDAWPERAGVPVTARLQIFPVGTQEVCRETTETLPATPLEFDVPMDIDLRVPTAGLEAGEYRLVFDLLDASGSPQIHKDAGRSRGALLTLTQPPAAPRRNPLVDPETAVGDFSSVAYADSHGAFDRYLGAGMLYYTLGQVVRSQVSVCIGSGGGFVPSLMRRAQLDAGIEPASTILIDANLPDLAFGSPGAAGGWLTDENRFLEREQDIQVLSMLSADAAPLLAAEGLRIDHLHIDGDHSARGVLADYSAYSPLLSDRGIVTFHDLRLKGVEEALSEIIGKNPHLEFLSFPEIGSGTGILRKRLPADTPRLGQTRTQLSDPNRKTTVNPDAATESASESQHKARFERWDYLDTGTYQSRYRLVADWIDDADKAVVEIGGFPNSIVGFLSRCKRVHAVEPYLADDFRRTIGERAKQQDCDLMIHNASVGDLNLDVQNLKPYNLVCLGLDISSAAESVKSLEASLRGLIELITEADLAALEIPRFRLSLRTFSHLKSIIEPEVLHDFTMDFSGDPVADSYYVKDERAVRRVMLLKADAGFDAKRPAAQVLLKNAAQDLFDAAAEAEKPADTSYKLGEEIQFHAGGNADPYLRAGWVGREKHHSWMQGEESWMVMVVDELRTLQHDQTLELLIQGRPFVVPGKHEEQTLTLRVNGAEVGTLRLKEATTARFTIPVSVIGSERILRLCFAHPDARRPVELIEGSTDKKILAFAAQVMTLKLRENHHD
ncbi:MAG: class I SAM-dependent methyltransferase [Pseudomonadota bacterium]